MPVTKLCQNVKIVPSCANGGCNTIKAPSRTIYPAKKWGFTLNNYTESDICAIIRDIKSYCRFGIFSREVGELGTPHLQGYFEFRKKRRPIGVFKNKRIHFDKKNASRVLNVKYVEKDGDIVFRYPTPFKTEIEVFYPWETFILHDILLKPINERIIYWFFEAIGNAGKTTFMKYVFTHYKRVVVLSGKATDMKNGIISYEKREFCLPTIVLIDIPRSKSLSHISMPGIEEIKNMFFFSGKYEGGMICGESPHVIIMANEPPLTDLLSKDRWRIFEILEDNDFVPYEEKLYGGYDENVVL